MFDTRPLQSATFRHLAAAAWVNEAGNAIGEVALAVLVYDRTGSPLASSLLFLALRVLPAVLAPLLTAYVEAINTRMVLTCVYLLEACLFAAIAAVAHHFSLPLVLVLVAIDGVLAILASTLTRGSIANYLVVRGLLREGNGVINLGTMVAFAAAPVVSGAIIAWRGASTALMIDAASFLVAALVIVTASGIRIESDRDAQTAGRLRAGVATLRRRVAVRRLLIAVAFATTMASIAVPIEVVFAQTTLHVGSAGYGLLLTSWGSGMIVGGAIFALARQMRLIRLLGITLLLVAVGYGGLALSPTLFVACVFSVIGGIGNGAAAIAGLTELQHRTPLNAQGAVMSVFYALNYLMPAVGFVIGGAVTEISSPRVAYAIASVGTALAVAVFTIRPIDRVGLRPVDDQPIRKQESDEISSAQTGIAAKETPVMRRNHDSPSLETG
jgi:predicted MFS family arabinose efflux permease